ncbi:NBS-LRR disease resistance-like protein [Quillaja saponaria]|uniref:NBS-LRR disease resistance-like protein n=1 Tax=Quillaja saponaria TaxID=32244 RepID=A0AAD7VNP9_QUISA|nr:NBS-LRR disease resistance-like protein [Quillaja saponaria]
MHNLFPSLQKLDLIHCLLLESFPKGGLPSKLNFLAIHNCTRLIASRMDWGFNRLYSVEYFSISGVNENFESFPEEGLLPTSLCTFVLSKCWNLKSIHYKGLLHLTDAKRRRMALYDGQPECLASGGGFHLISISGTFNFGISKELEHEEKQ